MKLKLANPVELKGLFNNPWRADFFAEFFSSKLTDKPRQRVIAHSVLVKTMCPALAEALNLDGPVAADQRRLRDPATGRELPVHELDTTSVSPETFINLMKYLYSGEWKLTIHNCSEVAALAHKLRLPKLHAATETVVASNSIITEDTLAFWVKIAKFSHLAQIRNQCRQVIFGKPNSLLLPKNAFGLPPGMIRDSLSSDHLLLKETDVFEIIKLRASRDGSEPRLTPEIQALLLHVRYNGISPEELESAIVPTGLLTEPLLFIAREMAGSSASTRMGARGDVLERAPKTFLHTWFVPAPATAGSSSAAVNPNSAGRSASSSHSHGGGSSHIPSSSSAGSAAAAATPNFVKIHDLGLDATYSAAEDSDARSIKTVLHTDCPLHTEAITAAQRKRDFDFVEFVITLPQGDDVYIPMLNMGVFGVRPKERSKLTGSSVLGKFKASRQLDNIFSKCPDPAVRQIFADNAKPKAKTVDVRVGMAFRYTSWELYFSVNGEVVTGLPPISLMPIFQREVLPDPDDPHAIPFAEDLKITDLSWYPYVEISGCGDCAVVVRPLAGPPR